MGWNIDDVPVFVAVVEQKGVSAAAAHLNMPKSTVSKAVTRLEDALGLRLFDRNSRTVTVTRDGEVFYRHAQSILEQVREASAVMAGLTSEPSGRLVAAVPMAFGREIVAPHLVAFRRRYPKVALELVITGQAPDLIRDQIDLAVVVGELSDSELIVKPLYKGDLVWVASADYAAAHALADLLPEAMPSHIHICEKRYAGGRLPMRVAGRKADLILNRDLMLANDPISVREAVAGGCGVSFVPRQYCRKHLESGALVEVFPQARFELSASTLSAVYPSRRLLSNKTRAFLDFLTGICACL